MNILYLVPYMPSLIRVRPHNLIRNLDRMGHKVFLFTLWTDPSEKDEIARLEKELSIVRASNQSRLRSIWNCLAALPTRQPLQLVYSWNPGLASQAGEFVRCNGDEAIDVIHIEHLRGARYGLFLKEHFPDTPVVWDSVDCISYLFEQATDQSRSVFGKLITRLDLNRTRLYEGLLPGKFDHILITSEVDRRAMEQLIPERVTASPISILPNGVDLKYYVVEPFVSQENATLIFHGKMSYHANVTMALYLMNEIMPRIWAKLPKVKLQIVGKDPPANIRVLGEHPLVTVTGTVEDIRPYLQSATMAVVPMVYGAGLQNKVLEAMACGTPVVATPQAVLALQAKPEQDLLLAQTPSDFAEQVIRLIENPDFRQKVGISGRRYVEEHHQWAKIAGLLEGVYHEVICTRPEQRIQ